MAAPRRAWARHTLRGEARSAAVVGPAPDPRQHHRHHGAQAQRAARGRASGASSSGSPATSTCLRPSRRSPRPPSASRPDALCTVSIYDESSAGLRHVAGQPPATGIPRRDRGSGDRGAQRLLRGGHLPAAPGRRGRDRARCALGAPAQTRARRRAARLLVHAHPRLRRQDGRHGRALLPPAAQPLETRLRTDGAPTALAGIAIERKRGEEALRRSEGRYRGLFENVIEGVYRATADGRLESVNPALVADAGLRARRGTARAFRRHATVYVDARRSRRRHRPAASGTASCGNAEYQLRRRDGGAHHGGRERAPGARRARPRSPATRARSRTSPCASRPRCSSPRRRKRHRSRWNRSATR